MKVKLKLEYVGPCLIKGGLANGTKILRNYYYAFSIYLMCNDQN